MTFVASKSVLGVLSTAAVGLGLAAAPVAVNTASAVIVGSPNMQQYCNRYHAPSRAVWVYQRNRWECAKITGRFSRLYYRINYALACRTTHGTARYRAYGTRVLCDRVAYNGGGFNNGGDNRRRLVSPNLRSFCWRSYRTTNVNFHYGRNRYVCTVRRGYSQTHYIINMRSACYYTRNTTRVTFIGGSPRHPRCVI
jgi:hypothetical protein